MLTYFSPLKIRLIEIILKQKKSEPSDQEPSKNSTPDSIVEFV